MPNKIRFFTGSIRINFRDQAFSSKTVRKDLEERFFALNEPNFVWTEEEQVPPQTPSVVKAIFKWYLQLLHTSRSFLKSRKNGRTH